MKDVLTNHAIRNEEHVWRGAKIQRVSRVMDGLPNLYRDVGCAIDGTVPR